MNRELVERATHPDPLKRIVEELGEDWLIHANKVTGDELADGLTASQAIIRRDKSFFTDNREVLFPTSTEEKIRTRLWDDGLDVELEPAPPSPLEAGAPSRSSRFRCDGSTRRGLMDQPDLA